MEQKDHREYLANQAREAAWSEAFINKTVHELNTNPRYTKYLSQYNADSVKSFISHYATLKTSWFKHGDSFSEHKRSKDEEWTKEGIEVLKQIQLKKLFDLTCRWANYELTLPGIEIAMELIDQQYKIFTCPYLPPVEQHEIDTYIDFLLHFPADESYSSLRHFDFTEYNFSSAKEPRWQTDEEYSPWFRWYDQVYGTAALKDKPAPKIDKEQAYDDKGREYENSLNPQPAYTKGKPYLSYYAFKDEYVQRFETLEYREMYAARRTWEQQLAFAEEIESDIILLSDATQQVPVEDNPDWRKALKNAAELHKRRLIIAELPYVYDEYLAKRKDGDSFDDWHRRGDPDFQAKYIAKTKERILQARKLLGEPGDFNF